MRISLFDESIPFDGFTPIGHPLGGAEKAFASLPGALARRGHEVTAVNLCQWSTYVDGAEWRRWDDTRPFNPDLLIAYRKPGLLGQMRQAGRRVLWFTGPCSQLDRPATRAILEEFKPTIVLNSRLQAEGWANPLGLKAVVIPPAPREDYRADNPVTLAEKPRALVTTHPNAGLDWLLALWKDVVHPAVPEAELHVFSAMLEKGRDGGEIPEAMRPLLAQALATPGLVLRRPQSDALMAEEYRQARVHLYPGQAEDMLCSTLMESQACGLPGVARPLGAAPERIRNGETGYLVPDIEAFGNLAVQLLSNEDLFWNMNREALLTQRGRSWDDAAAAFEDLP